MTATATPKQVAKRPMELFAEQIRVQRDRKGWTQKQLASRLGDLGFHIHQTTIGKWETCERRISLDEALAISVALDVCPTHMLAGSYLRTTVGAPVVALSPTTTPVSSREMRMWLRGQRPLWGQDERRYFTEVAADEWPAFRRPGVELLLRGFQELADAWAEGDRETAMELIEALTDELGRQHRALDRELRRESTGRRRAGS